MSEVLVTTETELLEVEVVQQELIELDPGTHELVETAEQGPPGIDGETIVSAQVIGDQIQILTNLGNTILVAGSVRGPSGNTGITVSPTPPSNPRINDLWLQIPGP